MSQHNPPGHQQRPPCLDICLHGVVVVGSVDEYQIEPHRPLTNGTRGSKGIRRQRPNVVIAGYVSLKGKPQPAYWLTSKLRLVLYRSPPGIARYYDARRVLG